MKQLNKKYNAEDNLLVKDLRSISRHFFRNSLLHNYTFSTF